jgi:hypothetical protein
MWKPFFRFCFTVPLVWAVSPALLITTAFVSRAQQQTAAPSLIAESTLKAFLQEYLRTQRSNSGQTTRYVDVFVDLSGDGKQEAIVYVTGGEWCGSGGCIMLVLAWNNSSYKVVSKTTITWPPIRVLRDTSNGWHSIGVWVQGGGIRPGYEAELRFDGQTYPANPSIAPARRLGEKLEGEVVVPSAEGAKPLYP